ncbi:MAG: hypothetical protein A4E44_00158 [Methanosaeta sp. PtaB.Bin018]|nr:MAG: hypothetical protein A4E44_00158 [Methanosaeta sp. PtaB.Bin018]OPY48110.1 MAG: hypothetical protein A4E46_00085 [Methanosaeta sp. PtaU1.Bin016]
MAAQPILFIGEREMAASMRDRLAKIDQAITLLQAIRRETGSLLAEMFPEAV